MTRPTLATGRAADVLEFWFGTADAAARGLGFDPRWFKKDPAFDEEIRRRLGAMYLDYEEKHLAIIERFGRYPHRDAVLGRASTAEERAFLTQPGSSF